MATQATFASLQWLGAAFTTLNVLTGMFDKASGINKNSFRQLQQHCSNFLFAISYRGEVASSEEKSKLALGAERTLRTISERMSRWCSMSTITLSIKQNELVSEIQGCYSQIDTYLKNLQTNDTNNALERDQSEMITYLSDPINIQNFICEMMAQTPNLDVQALKGLLQQAFRHLEHNPQSRQARTPRIGLKRGTFEESTWAHRPLVEDVYERLEEFFPEHDLDKPIIDANSGGNSPTAMESPSGIPPNDRKRITGTRRGRSFRIIAEEHKKRIDRTSRAETDLNANVIRKKTVSEWTRGKLLGKGSYGRVYLAFDAIGMFAVKQVKIPATASDGSASPQTEFVQALKMEIEMLKDLNHPHIVTYLGFEESPKFLSIFLEYVPGGSVGSCSQEHGKFDENVTKSFTTQILRGLAYLHLKNIIHRDLKGDNILVEKTGICKISDFGISKRTNDNQNAYTAMRGTLYWMAPEVIVSRKGRGYNYKADIWSVGCVVLEMWTGRWPWPDHETDDIRDKVLVKKESPPIPPNVILDTSATDFKDKCFAIDPELRPDAAKLIKHPYLESLPKGWKFNGFQ